MTARTHEIAGLECALHVKNLELETEMTRKGSKL